MDEKYFENLTKFLTNSNYYIVIYNGSNKYPIVEVKREPATGEYFRMTKPGGNVLEALNLTSKSLAQSKNITPNKTEEDWSWCQKTPIDDVITLGFIIKIFKLPTSQTLLTVCSSEDKEIPVRTIISDDIKSGIDTLNAILANYDFTFNKKEFLDEVNNHTNPVIEHKKTLSRKKLN